MDKSSLGGALLAVSGIGIGLVLEGGKLIQMIQPTAALIVFGGTIGAVMIQFPLATIIEAAKQLRNVFTYKESTSSQLVSDLIRLAQKARKDGLLSLDADLEAVADPFMKKSLMLAIDGTEPDELRDLMSQELLLLAEREEQVPKVFEAAGGFAPTIGIIGAVLGLIQVMQRLENINEVGKGIAVAFVATIYGVGSANILFLPAAGKLKIRLRERQQIREMTLEAVASILEGINPRALESKLGGYIEHGVEVQLQRPVYQ
ncbi:MAG TPA: flagellar motor protein [Acidisarcina sp.]